MSGFRPEPFGKYYLVDKIATGGMAEIFKAKTYSHGGFENLMVIKRILSHLGENEDFVSMFIDEAKVSVALQHANITRIYDFGKLMDNYFIAMECVDGKDVRNLLRKLARKRQYLPIEFAAYIGHQACRGLVYAHEKRDVNGKPYGIVHRDISPANILVSYEGDVKIADFGIAKAELNSGTTDVGVLKGKFEYMSPEQARGEDIDGRSDLFSLGIVLHEVLTGRRLFKADNDAASLERIKNGVIAAPSEVNQRVPKELDDIVMKALERDIDKRYQSAREMQSDLEACLYPKTTDISRQALARFMQSVFEEEITAEKERLQQGSLAAEHHRSQFPEGEEWDENVTTTFRTEPQPRSWVPFTVIGLLAILLSVAASVLIVLWLGANATQTVQVPEIPEPEPVPVVAAGTLDITLFPAGMIWVNGTEHGESQSLTLSDLTPGEYAVKVTAAGYEDHEDTIEVTDGGMAKFIWRFRRLRGTEDVKPDTTPVPEPPKEDTAPKKESPKPAEPGSLSIGIIGGGWATVYIDGKALSQTAPLMGHALPVGQYTVRVVNADLGLDKSQTVEIKPGQKARLNIRP